MNDTAIYALLVGLAVGSVLYVGFARRFDDGPTRRACAVASFAIGLMASLWYRAHEAELEAVVRDLAVQSVAVVFVALAAAMAAWKIRSWFR